MNLWNNNTELHFFETALKNYASPEKLFYKLQSGEYAYVPKKHDAEGQTLQSRNSLIGQFTEKWCKDIFNPIARKYDLFAVNSVECPEVALLKRSEADLAFCTTNSNIQPAKNIKIIFEIKMSIVSNYRYTKPDDVSFIGDYKSHKGNPSFLRSDSMLKAIGKSINIRVSGIESTKIPIIILGNSPIQETYTHKVDFLKTAGVIQGFWSLNPDPTNSVYIKNTKKQGFQTITSFEYLDTLIHNILDMPLNYFSSMIPKAQLGEFIRISHTEETDEKKAEKFLSLIQEL